MIDFFGGSGTTAVAASETSRNWIVCDSSEIAIYLTISRLEKSPSKSSHEIINLTNE